MNDLYIMHYGVGHDKGGHSGRYPWGSGENPRQDDKMFRKMIKKNLKQSNKKDSKMFGNQFSFSKKRNYLSSVISRSRKYTTFQWANKKNRPEIKAAIKMEYETNPKFRQRVQEAKKEMLRAAEENDKIIRSYVDNYKKNYPDKVINYKSQKLIDKVRDVESTYKKMDDVEYATTIMFDNRIGENAARAGAATTLAVLYAIGCYEYMKNN